MSDIFGYPLHCVVMAKRILTHLKDIGATVKAVASVASANVAKPRAAGMLSNLPIAQSIQVSQLFFLDLRLWPRGC